MNIYLSNETNFNNNGLGFLKDCLTAKVTESLNGDMYLEFTYPINGNLNYYLTKDNIVKCNVGNSNYQLFRIKKVVKSYTEISVYALHIFYDLLDNFLLDTNPKNLNAKDFGTWILSKTNFTHNFIFYSDITDLRSARYVRKNPIEAILGAENSMVNLFGGELERDNFNIKFLSHRGQNRGVKLIFGKNIKSIKITYDITSMYTRVCPLGFDGLMLPEKYVDSPLINNYLTPKITKIEFSDIMYDETGELEGAYTNIEEAYQALRDSVNSLYDGGLDKPNINVKIDWIELSKTEEYKNYSYLEKVYLGDTLTANILDLDYTAQVIKTVYNVLTDTIDKFEIGTVSSNIVNTVINASKKVENINLTSVLDSAKNNATNLITSAMGGYVYKTQNELYIMDTDDPNTAQKVWRWNINGLGYSSTGINGQYGIAMTMDGQIVADMITTGTLSTNRIQGYGDLLLEVHDLNEKIQDIADITVAEESDNAKVELLNVNESEPITIKIHPINESICYLYPRNGLYPSNTLMLKNRKVEFHNKTTDEYFYWEIPTNLWYYDSDNYDELSWDYETETITVNRKCKINADGTISKLATATTETYEFPLGEVALTTGNYEVKILGYSSAYIYIRLMASNIYTTQFATRAEMNASINITKENIIDTVSANFTSKNEKTELQSQITQNATSITNEVTRATNSETNLSSKITQNATSITNEVTRATNSETNLSSKITQNADSIASEITDRTTADNNLSSRINQTAKGISLSVNNGSASSGITITTTKEDGTSETTTGTIEMTGIVKFTDLSTSGKTTINGANIQTGTLSASKITTGSLSASRISGGTFNGDNMTIKNLSADSITTGSINGIPYSYNSGSSNGKVSLGNSDGPIMGYNGTSKRWSIAAFTRGGRFQTFDSSENIKAYLDQDGVHNSSDIRLKENISDIDENVSINVINNLIPIEYTYKNEKTYHRGLSAQQTKETLNKNGINEEIYEINKDGYYSLNYIELIPDLINCIKYQQKEIEELKRKIGE